MACPPSCDKPVHDSFNTKIRRGTLAIFTSPKVLHATSSLTDLPDAKSGINDVPSEFPNKLERAPAEALNSQPLFTASLTRSPSIISGTGSRLEASSIHKPDPKHRGAFFVLAHDVLKIVRSKTSFGTTLPSDASSNVLSDTESGTTVEASRENHNTNTRIPSTHTNPGEIVRFWRKLTRRWSDGDLRKKKTNLVLRAAAIMKEKEAQQEASQREKGYKVTKKHREGVETSGQEKRDEEERNQEEEKDEEGHEDDEDDEDDDEAKREEGKREKENENEILSTPISTAIKMTASEVVSALVSRGCKDLSRSINRSTFSTSPIACGGLSDIYRGQLRDDRLVAVKAWRISTQQNVVECSRELWHAAEELYTWSKCDHPNVLRLLGLATFRGRIGMVSPWMSKGTLPQYMKNEPILNRHNLCVQICEGLTYLHETGIVHGDLKGANILIADDGTPVLADFGSSIMKDQTLKITYPKDNRAFTVRWTAPELLESKATCRHTKQSDVYALGMTLYEVVTGDIPYHLVGWDPSVIVQIIKGTLPTRPVCVPPGHESDETLWNLFVLCWKFKAEERPSAAEVAEKMKLIPLQGVVYSNPQQPNEIDGEGLH